MNHYDDIQRFKDKTHTQGLSFKDLSGYSCACESGDWAIINQLTPSAAETPLAMGGSISLPAPQPVSPDLFAAPPAGYRSPPPECEAAVTQNVTPAALPVAPPAIAPSAGAPPSAPAAWQSSISPLPVDYVRLFAVQATDAGGNAGKDKDQFLKSLLERIATCR